MSSKPKVDFKPLRARLERLERRYNPDQQNLHFEVLPAADGELYPALVDLARDGYDAVRRSRSFFMANSLYDDGMFWYDLFLLISAASGRVAADKAQSYIPAKFVDDLLMILVRIGQFSTVNGGDITKRNHEALGNTLLRFYEKRRVRLLRETANKASASVKRFVKMTIARVEELRAEHVPTAPTKT